ncbi:MAG: hypothetical protein KatS3mg024_1313 [Armatimonadota bacterium]|nr:MAG: hypothetical protein KatS3mg024_1313 [Armatimonadota bacterium]
MIRMAWLAATLLAVAGACLAQPAQNNCWDPSLEYGAGNKVFYEGWGYGPPAGDYSRAGSQPYLVRDYGRDWTSIGPNPLAWVISGKNGQSAFTPKPPQYASDNPMRENDDYTNSGSAYNAGYLDGSWPYADTPFRSGIYVDGPQPYHMQSVWFDVNGNGQDVGDGVNRLQILLKHPIPDLSEPRKVRVDVQYWWSKNWQTNLGFGIRLYFEKTGGGEAWIDFAPHNYNYADPKQTKFAFRIVGIAEHPEWEQWSDTYLPVGAGNFAAPEDKTHWRHVGIDFGLIEPESVTLVTRQASFTEQENRFARLSDLDIASYFVRPTALAVGIVDEAPNGPTAAPGSVFMDNVWVSTMLPPVTTIAGVKQSTASAPVEIASAIVTAQFHDDQVAPFSFAVESPDRASGIRVLWQSEVAPGDDVSISGKVAVDGAEIVIQASQVSVNSSGLETPAPLTMTGAASGGGKLGLQAGVVNDAGTGAPAQGLNNIGLLVTLFGKVTQSLPGSFQEGGFYVDDGSGLSDGSGNRGISCRPPSFFGFPGPVPDAGRYVKVTGVMGARKSGSLNVRYLWTTGWEYLD